MKMKPVSWNDDKMREKQCKVISTCGGGTWSLRLEDQSQRDETLQGTKCEIVLGLASIPFSFIWKIKWRNTQSNQMKVNVWKRWQ